MRQRPLTRSGGCSPFVGRPALGIAVAWVERASSVRAPTDTTQDPRQVRETAFAQFGSCQLVSGVRCAESTSWGSDQYRRVACLWFVPLRSRESRPFVRSRLENRGQYGGQHRLSRLARIARFVWLHDAVAGVAPNGEWAGQVSNLRPIWLLTASGWESQSSSGSSGDCAALGAEGPPAVRAGGPCSCRRRLGPCDLLLLEGDVSAADRHLRAARTREVVHRGAARRLHERGERVALAT